MLPPEAAIAGFDWGGAGEGRGVPNPHTGYWSKDLQSYWGTSTDSGVFMVQDLPHFSRNA